MVFDTKKIIDQEQISFSRSDIDKEIENLVSRSPNSEQEIRRFYKNQAIGRELRMILQKKNIRISNAVCQNKEVEVNTKDLREKINEHR